MDTSRAVMPLAFRMGSAATINCTSDPVAMRMMSGLAAAACAFRTYAPRVTPSAEAYTVRSSVGTFWRVSERAVGRWRSRIATFHAQAVSLASPGRMNTRSGMARSAA